MWLIFAGELKGHWRSFVLVSFSGWLRVIKLNTQLSSPR